MKADDAKRLKELERENTRLKRIMADKELAVPMITTGRGRRRGQGGSP
jgi:putative transposase